MSLLCVAYILNQMKFKGKIKIERLSFDDFWISEPFLKDKLKNIEAKFN